MIVANLYSHLNGYEYMMVHRKKLWDEIVRAINDIDANQYTKLSKAKPSLGKIHYDQKALNKQFEHILFPQDWKSVKTPYYVTGDIKPGKLQESGISRNKKELLKVMALRRFARITRWIL